MDALALKAFVVAAAAVVLVSGQQPQLRLNYQFLRFTDDRIEFSEAVSGDDEFHVEFPVSSDVLLTKSLRVTSRILDVGNDAESSHRILVGVRHSRGQINWDIVYDLTKISKL